MDIQSLINFISKYASLNDKAVEALQNCVEIETVAKNSFILVSGQVCQKIWFVESGMVRKFHLADGNECTSWIHFENEMLTSLNSYLASTPANEYLQACEDSILISITKKNSQSLNVFPQFMEFSNRLLSEQLAKIDFGSNKLKTMSATEKYSFLLSLSPQLFTRAKLGYIASIMGITQETLSRIRKQA